MGTPHLGSDIAGKGNAVLATLRRVFSVGGFGVNVENRLLKCLKSNSAELWEITKSFTQRQGDIKRIVTCIEQHVVSGMTALVSGVSISPSILQFLTFSVRLWTTGQLH